MPTAWEKFTGIFTTQPNTGGSHHSSSSSSSSNSSSSRSPGNTSSGVVNTAGNGVHHTGYTIINNLFGLLTPGSESNQKQSFLNEFQFNPNDQLRSDLLNALIRTLVLKEFSTRPIQSNNEYVRIWGPNIEEIIRIINKLSYVQKTMNEHIFSTFMPTDFSFFNQSSHENQIQQLNAFIHAGYYRTGIDEIIVNGTVDMNSLPLGFKAYCVYSRAVNESGIGEIEKIESAIINSKQLIVQWGSDGSVFIDEVTQLKNEIASIERRISELERICDKIDAKIENEGNKNNPYYHRRKEIIKENLVEIQLLAERKRIYTKILSNTPKHDKTEEDPLSHCITVEEYQFLENNPISPHIDEREARNTALLCIARRMIEIPPGIKKIRELIAAFQDHITKKLLITGLDSITPYIEQINANINVQDMDDNTRVYMFKSYMELISRFFDRITLLSTERRVTSSTDNTQDESVYHIHYKQNDYRTAGVLRGEYNSTGIKPFIAASDKYNKMISPLERAARNFMKRLVQEINNTINSIDEHHKGFLENPSQESAERIIEKLKHYHLCIKHYRKLFPSHDWQSFSQFIVKGHHIDNANAVIEQLFSIASRSIISHMEHSKLDDKNKELQAAVLCYTTLREACKKYKMPYQAFSQIERIQKAAHRIKNDYIKKIKVIPDIQLKVQISAILEYSDTFYHTIARPLNIQWITQDELIFEITELFVNNPVYSQRITRDKSLHHRNLRFLIDTRASERTSVGFLLKLIVPLEERHGDCLKIPSIPPGASYNITNFYIKIIDLILDKNPQIHRIDVSDLATNIQYAIIKHFLKKSEQINTYISTAYMDKYELATYMEKEPAIALDISEKAIQRPGSNTHDESTITECTLTRARPIPHETSPVVTSRSIGEGSSSSTPALSFTEKAKQQKKKTAEYVEGKGKRAAFTLKHILDESPPVYPEDAQSPEPESDNNEIDLTALRLKAATYVKSKLAGADDEVIYQTLIKHYMRPEPAFKEIQAKHSITFDKFHEVATKINIYFNPSINFVSDMATLAHTQGPAHVRHAIEWTKLLDKEQPYQFIRSAYRLITEHSDYLSRNKHLDYFSRTLTTLLLDRHMDLMPNEYIALIDILLIYQTGDIDEVLKTEDRDLSYDVLLKSDRYPNRNKRIILLKFINLYIHTRDLSDDYDNDGALKAHYDLLIRCRTSLPPDYLELLNNIILQSSVYGHKASYIALKKLFNTTDNKNTIDPWDKIEPIIKTINQALALHITEEFSQEIITEDPVSFHHKMLVLMRNPMERIAVSQTPLRPDGESGSSSSMSSYMIQQEKINRAFINALTIYLSDNSYTEDINFSKNVHIYLTWISESNINIDDITPLVKAISALSLANLNNIENDLVIFIKILAQKELTAELEPLLIEFREKMFNESLIKPITAMLLYFDSMKLPYSMIGDFRKKIISASNDNDKKILSESGSAITVFYRNLLSNTYPGMVDLQKIMHEIKFLIDLFDNIPTWNEASYPDNFDNASRQAYSFKQAGINARLFPLIHGIKTKPSDAESKKISSKLKELYTRLMELMIIQTLNNLPSDEVNEAQRLKVFLEGLQNNNDPAQTLARAKLRPRPSSSLNFISRRDTAIDVFFNTITLDMVRHTDNYTITLTLNMVTNKINNAGYRQNEQQHRKPCPSTFLEI